jgi:uncharacterized protein with HEPN domain
MSKSRRDLDFLHDIQEAIDRSLAYTNGLNWGEYLQDHKTQDAVARNLEVLGEATKNLSEDLRNRYPSVPWRVMSGTRDRLIHHYFGINQEIVWQIVRQDLPELQRQIAQVIREFPAGED